MIKPTPGFVIIEPLKYETFISSQKGTFEEVGIVVDSANGDFRKGWKVWFDGWLAGKFPKNDKEFFWIVSDKDIKAFDNGDEVSK